MTSEKYYKTAKDTVEFTDLVADIKLRKNIAVLNFGDDPDKVAVERILRQKGFSENQRNWMNSLLLKHGG